MNKMLITAFLAVFGLGAMSANAGKVCNTPVQDKKFYVNKKPIAGYPAGVQHPAGAQCVKMRYEERTDSADVMFYIREEGEKCSDVYEPSYYLQGSHDLKREYAWAKCRDFLKRWNKNAIRFFKQYKKDDGTPYTPVQTTGAQGDLPSGCAAFAKGDDGNTYKGASRDSKENAEKLALFECRSATTNCKVEFSICN